MLKIFVATFSALTCTLIITTPLWATSAVAQPAGRRLGACGESVFLTEGQVTLAVALSTLGSTRPRITGDDNMLAAVRECASTIAYHVCTDDDLLGYIDPLAAIETGLAGAAVDKITGGSLLGVLGATVGGLTFGIVENADCMQMHDAAKPHADAVFAGSEFNVDGVTRRHVTDAIRSAAQRRVVPAESAQHLLDYIENISDRLID